MCFKNAIIFLLTTLLIAGNVQAISKCNSIDEFRKEDSKRAFVFFIDTLQFGKLESIYKGKTRFDGTTAYEFRERLSVDYSVMGNPFTLEIDNKHYISREGHYLGDKMKVTSNGQEQKLFLKHTGDSITGHFTDGDTKQSINLPLSPQFFAVDNNMIDQIETFLAFKDIEVGDTIVDSFFIPQIQTKSKVRIAITDFSGVYYGGLFDSAYTCHFLEPTEQTVYFSKEKKLLRLNIKTPRITIIRLEDPFERFKPKSVSIGFGDFIKRTPIFLFYILAGFLIALPVSRNQFRKPEIYIALILGGIFFPLSTTIMIPLQKWYASTCLIPAIREGESLYKLGIIPAIMSGFIQEVLKLIPITLLMHFRKPRGNTIIIIGLFCGLGFGIYEAGWLTGAGYQMGTMKILSWVFFERFITILFHGASGAALGFGFSRGFKSLIYIWLSLTLVNSITNYMVLFYQKGLFNMAVHQLLTALINLFLVLFVYIIIRKYRR